MHDETIEVWPEHSLSELEELPTLCVGQSDNLKVETFNTRVWLARTGVADGESFDHRVSVESPVSGRWIPAGTYQARD